MPQPAAGDFADELLRRTRDPGGGATSPTQALLLLTHSQRLINVLYELVLEEREFTLEPQRCIYNLDEAGQILGSPYPRLLGVKYEGVSLVPAKLGELTQTRRSWLREFAPQPHSWAPYGNNLFIIWPAPFAERVLVTLVLLKQLPDLEPETLIEIPSEYWNRCLDLAEGLIWIRRRLPEAAKMSLGKMGLTNGQA